LVTGIDAQRIAYRLCNVKTAKGQKEFASTGIRAVPVLKIGNKLLNGFSVKEFHTIYEP